MKVLGENESRIKIGEKHQATRYPVFKPNQLPWGFDYEVAER